MSSEISRCDTTFPIVYAVTIVPICHTVLQLGTAADPWSDFAGLVETTIHLITLCVYVAYDIPGEIRNRPVRRLPNVCRRPAAIYIWRPFAATGSIRTGQGESTMVDENRRVAGMN